MGTFAVLGLLIIICQASAPLSAEETSCVPGFESDMLIFKVTRKHLRSGTRLGKVGVTDCTERKRFLFSSDDGRFNVQTDGILTVKRQVVLHEGHKDFNISSWDSQGCKMTVPVRVVYDGHHHGQNHVNNTESAVDPQMSILHFPKSGEGLRRHKRDWGLFDLSVVENNRTRRLYPIRIIQDPDFEKTSKHTLLVTAENEAPFTTPLPTSTATVVVNVEDVNEAPVFDPKEKFVSIPEDLAVDSEVVQYKASDPDTARNQKVMYKIISDPAGWLNVDKKTGLITVNGLMDRESHFVKDNKYTALIGAYDDDEVPATGTGTLMIQLEDVNDNAPTIIEREIRMCNKEPAPQLLTVIDKDGPGFAAPYSVSLVDAMSKANWTARMNETRTGIVLNLAKPLESGRYTVVLRVSDNLGLGQINTVYAEVCECTGAEVLCVVCGLRGSNLPVILGISGGILLLLVLLLLLMLFLRQRRREEGASTARR